MTKLQLSVLVIGGALGLAGCDGATAPRVHSPALVNLTVGHDGVCGVDSAGRGYCSFYIAPLDTVDCQAGQCAPGLREVLGLPALNRLALAEGSFGDAYCGVTRQNTAYCWGHLWVGFDNSLEVAPDPAPLVDAPPVSALGLGPGHICVVSAAGDGTFCWGDYEGGRRGQGPTVPAVYWDMDVNTVANSAGFVTVSAGWNHTCALDAQGGAWCWGDGRNIGNPGATLVRNTQCGAPCTTSPVPVAGLQRYQSIDASDQTTCAVRRSTGVVDCWGYDAQGTVTAPQPVDLPISAVGVVTGGTHSCAWASDGTAYCWGDNSYGQLGDATAGGSSPTPVMVQAPVRFTVLDAAELQTCGLDEAGALWCWGAAYRAGLGTDETPVPTPRKVTIYPPATP